MGALTNGFLVELMNWMPDDLFIGLPHCADGHLTISDRPGHGLAFVPWGGAEVPKVN